MTAVDTRWARCDIKSVALLANVLLRQQAVEAGAAETILLRDGELTEASASAVHVVIGGELLTPPAVAPHPARHHARRGRGAGGALRAPLAVGVGERGAAARRGRDLAVGRDPRGQAVTRLDGRPVGAGKPGPLWRRVYGELQRYKEELAGTPW